MAGAFAVDRLKRELDAAREAHRVTTQECASVIAATSPPPKGSAAAAAAPEEPPTEERLRLVLQRADSCRLLQRAGEPDEAWAQTGAALVVYVSFTGALEGCGAAERQRTIDEAVKAVLHLPVMTRGQWGDGAKTESVLELSQSEPPLDGGVSVVIVPQASLSVKVKGGGKTVSYRNLASREAGEELYNGFVEAVRAAAASAGKPAALSGALLAARHAEEVAKKRLAALVPPDEFFKRGEHEGKFGVWDERGVPTADAAGTPLAKNACKKLEKAYASHCKAYEKERARQAAEGWAEPRADVDGGVATPAAAPAAPAAAAGAGAGAEAALRVVPGTYGARQGLSLEAACGPFSHVVSL